MDYVTSYLELLFFLFLNAKSILNDAVCFLVIPYRNSCQMPQLEFSRRTNN